MNWNKTASRVRLITEAHQVHVFRGRWSSPSGGGGARREDKEHTVPYRDNDAEPLHSRYYLSTFHSGWIYICMN